MGHDFLYVLFAAAGLYLIRKAYFRLRLSKAKHPSLRGHSNMSRHMAKLVPFFAYDEARVFSCDGAPESVVAQRRAGFERLKRHFSTQSPQSIAFSEALEDGISDVPFINAYRVPFPFRNFVSTHFKVGAVLEESAGVRVRDLDDHWAYDLGGSYGVNVFGYDFYKECMDRGIERVRDLGPVLGRYHPLIAENVEKLKQISGLDEVSFHMSGTEAVMQAVRLARYHTGKPKLVRFCGAYHGWWDGVQPGVGNQRSNRDVYTLKDMDGDTLAVLATRKDIACVLVNPLQALHPNANAPGDAMLIASDRQARFDRRAYADWLRELRTICSLRGIVLIFDEIFVGFRLAYGGAQEYFGVKADLVTYGKTLGGGLPVGVVCGKRRLMKRYREDRPTQVCFARGTFNSHPYVMGAMNEFLRRIETPAIRATYEGLDTLWNDRAAALNGRLEERDLPVRVVNLVSIWTVTYTKPGRYNWMFQYYLRAHGLALAWTGTGRFIFSHNYRDEDFEAVMTRFVAAAEEMATDGWWYAPANLTNKAIKKAFFREMLGKRFGFGKKSPRREPLGLDPERAR